MIKSKKYIWILAIAFVLLSGGIFAWFVYDGCIFPIHYVKYFNNGRISEEGYRIKVYYDREHYEWWQIGNFVSYYNNGNKFSEGAYDQKQRHEGRWTYYHEDGSIKEIVEYENGAAKRTILYKNGLPGAVEEIDEDIPHYSWIPGGYPCGNTPEGIHNRELKEKMYDSFVEKYKSGIPKNDAYHSIMKEYLPQLKKRPGEED
jgi:antitoxin component YwqK of YwqJK toxin-antitoxin module